MDRFSVMPGVTRHAYGIHSTDSGITLFQPIAIDRRDCPPDEFRCELPHELICTKLVHFTENQFAESIGLSSPNDFIFRPRRVFCSLNLSWFSPIPPTEWRTVIENNLPETDPEDFDIGNSQAFCGASLCGPIGIIVKWKDILTEYANSRQRSVDDIEFRNLGTSLYTREIMFAVMVCMRGDVEVTTFPLINASGTNAFVPRLDDFTWKVYSTVGYNGACPSDVFWTWDHLSFGFHCPTSDLKIRNEFCDITSKKATSYRPRSRLDASNRSFSDRDADVRLLHRLAMKLNRVSSSE